MLTKKDEGSVFSAYDRNGFVWLPFSYRSTNSIYLSLSITPNCSIISIYYLRKVLQYLISSNRLAIISISRLQREINFQQKNIKKKWMKIKCFPRSHLNNVTVVMCLLYILLQIENLINLFDYIQSSIPPKKMKRKSQCISHRTDTTIISNEK